MSETKNSYHHGNLRQGLIDEARHLIQEQGAQALTLRELGHRLGVSRTAPYRHFKDRKDLLSAVAQQSAMAFGDALEAARGGEGNVLARFRAMGRAYLRFAQDDPCGYRLMFHEPQLLAQPAPGLKLAMNRAFDALRAMVVEGQEAGLLKGDDAGLLATYIWSVVHGLASLIIDGRIHDTTDPAQLLGFAEQRLYEGIGRVSVDSLWQRLTE